MKNRLADLNDHLFAQLERLGDEEMTQDALLREISRANAITGVAAAIVNNASLALKAQVAISESMVETQNMPAMFATPSVKRLE